MKKFLSYALPALVLTLAASFAKANDYGDNINVSTNGIVKVMVSNVASLQDIRITDANGVQLYEYSDMKPGAFKNLDFSAAPDGQYFIKVENDKTIETTQVDKVDGQVVVGQKSSLLVKPVFKRSGERLNVFFMNPDKSDVQLDVYNEYNVLVNSVEGSAEVFQKALDFSKSLRGNYKVVLAQGDNTFSTDFDY